MVGAQRSVVVVAPTMTYMVVKKSTRSTAKKSTRSTAPTAGAQPGAAPVGPYTPVVRAGDWVIVSGQLGVAHGVIVEGGVAAQTIRAIANLKAHLGDAGLDLSDVKKTMCFLVDMDTFATFNEAYVAGFGDTRPARSTVGVTALPMGGAVEIEAWAFKPVR